MAQYSDTTFYFDIPNLHPEHKGRGLIPILLVLLALLLLYHLTQRMIRPITTLIAGVRRFGQGELDYRIQLKRRDELGELADSFNEMANDIQQMLDAKRQMLLAISHELRSPLTRAKVSLELIDDQQRLEIAKDLNEMEALIEELLETERLSTRHNSLNKQLYSLNDLIENVLQEYFTDCDIARELPFETISLELDGPRIKLLLKNLLDNALRYTPDGAVPPGIKLSRYNDTVSITVHDHGEGIAAQHVPHLTDPFYRADAARMRETGGYGLGLYLCRVITEAHEGQLSIQTEQGMGTTVKVTLPYTQR